MRTVIKWPDTTTYMSGMDRFCGGPEYEDRTAGDYYREAKPLVDRAVHNLEQEIDHLNFEIQKLKAAKPKLRFNSALGIWYVAPKEV